MYLFATWAVDQLLRVPLGAGSDRTTILTPLNPFLALEAQLLPRRYVALAPDGASGLVRWWFDHPVSIFSWGCVAISTFLVLFSTVRLRVIGARVGQIPWHRRCSSLVRKGASAGSRVESARIRSRGGNEKAGGTAFAAKLGRWSFVLAGVAAAIALLIAYREAAITIQTFRLAFATLLIAESVIIVLTALNLSATAVAREREDGTLDLILTTPIQPGPYLAGKLRGIIQNVLPMLLVPMISVILAAIFVLANGFGVKDGPGGVERSVMEDVSDPTVPGGIVKVPIVLPELAIALPPLLFAFTAFAVMVGLHWSIRSKGTIGSVTAAVAVVVVVGGLLGFCGGASGGSIEVVGAFFSALSPVNMGLAGTVPSIAISQSIGGDFEAARVALVVGAGVASAAWILVVWMMHTGMKKSFMMTVRRLAGVN